MAAFFLTAELQSLLQGTTINAATATLLAELASDAVREECGQTFDLVLDDTVTLYGDGSAVVQLPQLPVVSVASVSLAGAILSAGQYNWRPDGSLYRVFSQPSQMWDVSWWPWPVGTPITVVYTHGYATVPSPVKAVALELAASAYDNPSQLAGETLGAYSYTTSRASTQAGPFGLSDEQKHRLEQYMADKW